MANDNLTHLFDIRLKAGEVYYLTSSSNHTEYDGKFCWPFSGMSVESVELND